MSPTSVIPAARRIAFRCDGDAEIGAGHVGRCLPLASAFAETGWDVGFVGKYEGLARCLIDRANVKVQLPGPDLPSGLDAGELDAVIVDSYTIGSRAICELAGAIPLATIAEASRCPSRGILLDYHLDRSESASDQLLAGPSFAPIDPGFVGARRPRAEVRRVLVTLGGSHPARTMMAEIGQFVSTAFPDAELALAGAAAHDSYLPGSALPSPSALVDVAADVDLAIAAAGFTAYELACAGIPQVAIATVVNQRRVLNGLREAGLAVCLDLTRGDSLLELPLAIEGLRDAEVRQRFAERGMEVFDGRGARRAAEALAERFATQTLRATRDAGGAAGLG